MGSRIERWNKVSGEKLAIAIYEVVKGDCRKLVGDPKLSTSVWGSIGRKLGSAFKSITDRQWIKTSWETNKLNVQVIHERHCKTKRVVVEKISEQESPIRYEKRQIYCICRKPEEEIPEHSMIECDNCFDWYHCRCVNASKTKYGGSVEWMCPRCRGDTTIDFVPRIFCMSQNRSLSSVQLETTSQGQSSGDNDESATSKENEGKLPFPPSSLLIPDGVSSEERDASASEHRLVTSTYSKTTAKSAPNPIQRALFNETNISTDPEADTTCYVNRIGQSQLFGNTLHENKEATDESDEMHDSQWPSTYTVKRRQVPNKPKTNLYRPVPTDFSDESDFEIRGFTSDTVKLGQPFVKTTHFESEGKDLSSQSKTSSSEVQDELFFKGNAGAQPSVQQQDSLSPTDQTFSVLQPLHTSTPLQRQQAVHRDAVISNTATDVDAISSGEESENLPPPITSDDNDLDEPNAEKNAQCIDGPTKYSQTITAVITKREWQRIKPTDQGERADNRYKFKLAKGLWGDVFADALKRKCPDEMKGCKITFKRSHRISVSHKNGKLVPGRVTAEAECTRKGMHCKMKYDFSVAGCPKRDEDVLLHIHCYGTLLHDVTIQDKRWLKGDNREKAKKQLLHQKASVLKRSTHGRMMDDNASKVALEKGNITSVQNLLVLRKARAELLAEGDFHSDILLDLSLRRENFMKLTHLKGTHTPGFIQELSLFPFYTSLYNEKQFNILKRLYALNKNTVLHIDSTGSVSGKLPEQYGATRQFYYAITVELPEATDTPCIPLFEFISNSHSATTVSNVLHWYFEAYGDYSSSTHRKAFGISRIETDCSRALISAVLQALEQGTTIIYLQKAWNNLLNAEKMDFVHHICRSHATKFVADRIKTVAKENEDVRKVLMLWFRRFVTGKDLWDYARRIEDIVLICGRKNVSKKVQETVQFLRNPTKKTGELSCLQLSLDGLSKSGPFYCQSPFSFFAILRCNRNKVQLSKQFYRNANLRIMEDSSDESAEDSQSTSNPYYSIPFLEYLIKWVFSLGCLFDHSLLTLNEISSSGDSNAVSESWNAVLKNDELKMELPMRIGRLVSRLEDNLKGRLFQFELALERQERKAGIYKNPDLPGTDPSDEDVENSRKQTGMTKQNEALEPERSREQWGKKKGKKLPSKIEGLLEDLPRIPYGGSFVHNGCNVILRNTCNIDNVIQILFTLYKINKATGIWLHRLAQERDSACYFLLRAFRHLDSSEWAAARKIILVNLLKVGGAELEDGDLYESEDRILQQLGDLFIVVKNITCKNPNCRLPKQIDICPMRDAPVSLPAMIEEAFYCQKTFKKCYLCSYQGLTEKQQWPAIGPPPFFCYYLNQVENVCKEEHLLVSQKILGVEFDLFAYTVLENNHYTTVFLFEGKRYIYNGLKNKTLIKYRPSGPNHSVSTVWLLKKQ